jgi:hypothetical protein
LPRCTSNSSSTSSRERRGLGPVAADLTEPNAGTTAEAIAAALTREEAERFEAHLRPLVDAGRGLKRSAFAYLCSSRPATQIGSHEGSRRGPVNDRKNDAKRQGCTRMKTRCSPTGWRRRRRSDDLAQLPYQGGGRGFESRRPLQRGCRSGRASAGPLGWGENSMVSGRLATVLAAGTYLSRAAASVVCRSCFRRHGARKSSGSGQSGRLRGRLLGCLLAAVDRGDAARITGWFESAMDPSDR